MSAVGEGMIDFTNNDVKAPERKNFENKETHVLRLKANQTVRIHFCSADVMMRRRHYNAKAQKGKYVRCLDYTGYCPVCVAASDKVAGCKKASETFGANILVYNMNSAGEVITPWDAEVYFWAFGAEKFVQIRQIVKEWGPINTLDFTVTCTDEDFQKMQISVCKESLYAKDADFKARMDAKIESDSYPLDKFLCKEQNIVQMCESFQLDQEKYIPLAIRQQMTGGGNAAQQAAQNYTQQTQQGGQNTNVASPQSPQQPQQNTQQPQQSVQQNVAQPQQTQQPSYTPPKADENSFASLEEIGNLI